MEIGERIRDARLEKGMSQKDLAKKVGIDPANLRKYEKNKQQPKFEKVKKIADVLSVDVRIFTDDECTEISKKLLDRNDLVRKEIGRLNKLFEDIPDNQKKLVKGLITQASRLKVLLDEMWIDISENGDYELFTQSENTPKYERERPVAKLYNNRDQSYQRVIRQLSDYLPEEKRDKVIQAIEDGSDLL